MPTTTKNRTDSGESAQNLPAQQWFWDDARTNAATMGPTISDSTDAGRGHACDPQTDLDQLALPFIRRAA